MNINSNSIVLVPGTPFAKKPIGPRHVKTLNNFASRFIEDAPGGHPDFEL